MGKHRHQGAARTSRGSIVQSRSSIEDLLNMNTNMNSAGPVSRGISGEGWAGIAGAVGSALLLAKKLLGPKPAKAELMGRADFLAEMLEIRERLHANQVSLLEKLDLNHRELLAALERQGARVTALEGQVARLEERTKA